MIAPDLLSIATEEERGIVHAAVAIDDIAAHNEVHLVASGRAA